MDFDDDAPPDLVEAGTELTDEEKPVKVPITIVTGKYHTLCITFLVAEASYRVPWCGKDYFAQLHTYG